MTSVDGSVTPGGKQALRWTMDICAGATGFALAYKLRVTE